MTAIGSEIAWLEALRADTELAVPEPVAARDGAPAVMVTTAGADPTQAVRTVRPKPATPKPITPPAQH